MNSAKVRNFFAIAYTVVFVKREWTDIDGGLPRGTEAVNTQWKGLENYSFIRACEDTMY